MKEIKTAPVFLKQSVRFCLYLSENLYESVVKVMLCGYFDMNMT